MDFCTPSALGEISDSALEGDFYYWDKLQYPTFNNFHVPGINYQQHVQSLSILHRKHTKTSIQTREQRPETGQIDEFSNQGRTGGTPGVRPGLGAQNQKCRSRRVRVQLPKTACIRPTTHPIATKIEPGTQKGMARQAIQFSGPKYASLKTTFQSVRLIFNMVTCFL